MQHLHLPGYLTSTLSDFQPEIVHSQHPFLLEDAALRIAATWNIPSVFTHHTQYDRYTHYGPGDSLVLKRFVTHLAATARGPHGRACAAAVSSSCHR